ncbi:protein kinase domain-containing protein [Haliangium sp.]|uniref:serine/threonine-protein kinase n=1 Tax=Haliangium sp. TaxID=2663208 RepID=UPI003D124C52
MDPARWRQIEDILHGALDRAGEQRDAFVAEACAGDEVLRGEVAKLLAADERSSGILDRPIPAHLSHLMRLQPPAGFESYQPIEFLGAGGRGSVYKARDSQLDRFVALKFLHQETPAMARRLMREAQAQASIDHPHICKVFEVGEVDGHPCIAMQYVDGCSLAEAQAEMTLADKVGVVKDIAEALHAAHERGLIHRDVKPGNILVERHADGWHPYITDFGLARELEAPGAVSATGPDTTLVEGTPGYMPPEQVCGERALLDRRVDVYALGATLYALLGGSPPFADTDPQELLRWVMERAPMTLQQRRREVPRDLDTIVMKCLEREPDQRYPSARDLAEDLQRYLNGDPIRARSATVRYVVGRKLRKHALLSALVAVATLCVLALAVAVVRERVRAARQAELAQEFGQEAQRIQHLVRHAHMSPLHDVRPVYDRVRARMAALERRMDGLGRYAEGPGHCALGIGHVALREYQRGLDHLRRARASGHRSAACEYALGDALYRVYTEKLWAEVVPMRDAGMRARAETRLKEEYITPAQMHMHTLATLPSSTVVGPGDVESQAYVQARLAFAEERYDDAIAHARASFATTPWMYEAKELEADAWLARAHALPDDDDDDVDGRVRGLKAARDALEQSIEIGRSDPGLYTRLAGVLRGTLKVERVRGGVTEELLRDLRTATQRALVANPDDPWALMSKAWSLYYSAQRSTRRGHDARAELKQAIALGEAAHSKGTTYGQALGLLGDLYLALGWYEDEHGLDPRPSMERARAYFDEAAAAQPESGWLWNDLGVLLCSLAGIERRFGGAADERFAACIEALERAQRAAWPYEFSHSNLAWALAERAHYELAGGRDPVPSVRRALAHASRAIEARPDNFHARNNAAMALLAQAEHELVTGRDPRATLDRAQAMSKAALRIDERDPEARDHLARARALRERYAARRAHPPAASDPPEQLPPPAAKP